MENVTVTPQQLAEMQANIDALQAKIQEQERIIAVERANHSAKGSGLKIGPKGTVVYYGVGKRGVALYTSQFNTLLRDADKIKAFIFNNWDALSHKEGDNKDNFAPAAQ